MAATCVGKFLTTLYFYLHRVELVRLDNGWVAVLYIVLGHLTLIDLSLFRQEIYSESFL
ncbi:MAG: hypothetical protein DDT34_02560 [Firmicutes bacterium]|nr:hypothetical protein [Bacillota bacterium]